MAFTSVAGVETGDSTGAPPPHGRPLVSGDAAHHARRTAQEIFAGDIRTLAIDAVCAEVVRRMRDDGLGVIVLKGPSFADWLYSDGTRRRYEDVDLLVPHAQFETAGAVLRSLDFAPVTFGEHPLRDAFAGQTWFRERDDAVVDLHARLHGVEAAPPVVWSELSADTALQRVGGIKVKVLRPDARAMHVALHAAQHGKVATKPIEDLRRALMGLDEDLWREAAATAERIEAVPAFTAGLCVLPQGQALAHRLGLPAAIPADIALRAGLRTPLALGLHAVAHAQGPVAKLRLLGRLAIPAPSLMRARQPLARRGPIGLACAYLLRVPYVLVWSGPAVVAWWRASRRSLRSSRPRPSTPSRRCD